MMNLQATQPTAQGQIVPAPTGGLNYKDGLATMPPTDALELQNLFPRSAGCYVRKGCQALATAFNTNSANTVASYDKVTGGSEIFYFTGADMVNATTGTPVSVLGGLADDKWQTCQFSNSAGHFLFAVNGVDAPILYDGSAIHRLAAGNGIDPYTIHGMVGATPTVVNPAAFVNLTTHQSRLWFVQRDTLAAWYLETSSIYGDAHKFDFGPLFQRGGYLVALMTWSLDAGRGSDDHLVAMTSRGEVAVYQGTDPAFADSWGLVGVYYIGEPMGYRCYAKLAGDLAILTQVGLVPLSQALQSTEVNANSVAFTDIIQHLISDLVGERRGYFGWCLAVVPEENWLLINVPNSDGSSFQLCMNTITQRWCSFVGWPTNHIALYDNMPAFVTTDTSILYRGALGNLDYVEVDGTGGSAIPFKGRQAYNYFNAAANVKLAQLVRPTFVHNGGLRFGVSLVRDFEVAYPESFNIVSVDEPLWDVVDWDTILWGGDSDTLAEWDGTGTLGYAISIQIKGTATTTTYWAATNVVYQLGGLLA